MRGMKKKSLASKEIDQTFVTLKLISLIATMNREALLSIQSSIVKSEADRKQNLEIFKSNYILDKNIKTIIC